MATWNEKFNWCDDEAKLADSFNHLCGHINWKMFENQEDWLYMVNELGKGRNPKIKSFEKFEEAFDKAYSEYTSMMKACIFYGFLQMYADDDIDLDPESAYELNDWLGFEGEDAYEGIED